jgi:hypothetical protein
MAKRRGRSETITAVARPLITGADAGAEESHLAVPARPYPRMGSAEQIKARTGGCRTQESPHSNNTEASTRDKEVNGTTCKIINWPGRAQGMLMKLGRVLGM